MDALMPANTPSDASNCSLQDAFKSFMKKKKMQLREQKRAEFVSQQNPRTLQEMESLRKKFLQTALAYIGVPYARKYHEPESPTHCSPLFLDCCGLVRRVLTDLKEDFGFTIGPWNQAYQFDTLPVCVSGPGDMKPGDLVFISGIYFNPRTRHQKHNMVHVEIWMGEGEKTLGARWQRGRVEIHDSYQFVSKSYHSMQYHFRSIDTWLAGVCQSHCSEHKWKRRKCFDPGKYSLFAEESGVEEEEDEDEEEEEKEEKEGEEGEEEGEKKEEEGNKKERDEEEEVEEEEEKKEEEGNQEEGDEEEVEEKKEEKKEEEGKKEEEERDEKIEEVKKEGKEEVDKEEEEAKMEEEAKLVEETKMEEKVKMDGEIEDRNTQGKKMKSKMKIDDTSAGGEVEGEVVGSNVQCPVGTSEARKYKQHTPKQHQHPSRPPKKVKPRAGCSAASSGQSARPQTGQSGFTGQSSLRRRPRRFIVCGGNGATLVREALLARSWVEMEDATSTTFTLKWVETNKQINHRAFREGEQMVNHFPNISLLTTKIGLLESLRTLERLQQTSGIRGSRPTSLIPETYRMDIDDERSEFMRIHSPGDIWICKPTGANQGKGIFIVTEVEQVAEKLEGDKKKCGVASRPTPRIVQRYISSPLLLEGRKFDIRTYLLIIGGRPYLTLFREGYIRLSCVPYDASSSDPCVHLTNQYQQRKHPTYADRKEETVWDMARFQAYLTSDLSLAGDWVSTTLNHRMKSIMTTCFQSVKHKLNNKVGYFDLLGFDFMLDSALNLWLIEVNINPALHTSCSTLQSLIPSLVEETLDIVIEVFEKNHRGSPALPLSSATQFTLLHC